MPIDTTQNIILTSFGETRKELAITDKNNPIHLMYMAVGDANGADDFTISKEQTYLINEVWRGRLISIQNFEGEQEGTVGITGYIPIDECGGNYLKEYGIFDSSNNLIFVGKLNNFYKPAITSENALPVLIQVQVVWGYTYGLSLFAANEYTYATKSDLLALNENTPNNKGAFIYFMSAPGRRKALSFEGSAHIKKVNTIYDAQTIVSDEYLLVYNPMTIRLPIIKNGKLHIKRMYEGGDDLILTTNNPAVNKIDNADTKVIDTYMNSYHMFCDGKDWFIS